jgi:hypothetical protein
MEINSLNASALTAISRAKTGDPVALTVFKKVLEVHRQSATQLIEVARAAPAAAGSSLGSHVDIRA